MGHRRFQAAFGAWVRRSDDRRLERTVGSPRGLRLLFAAMQASFVSAEAGDVGGEVAFRLRGIDGRTRFWTLTLRPDQALLRPVPALAPVLSVDVGLADFVRLAGRDLDVGDALLTGRLDLEGDFSLATRLGRMFGRASM